jgi:hypothetical protein
MVVLQAISLQTTSSLDRREEVGGAFSGQMAAFTPLAVSVAAGTLMDRNEMPSLA